jgi:hypothetical protein
VGGRLAPMPEKIRALFAALEEERERVQKMFLDAGMIDQLMEPAPSGPLYVVPLPNEEAAQRLQFAARANGLKAPDIQRWFDPTAKELAAAPLLYVRALGPATDRYHPREGTMYDDSAACPQCGAGLVQTSPFKMRKTELPKSYLAAGVCDDLVLHESVATIFEAAGLRGVRLREMLDRDDAPIPWRQVVVEETMPPMLATSRGMIRGRGRGEAPCGRCGRDGWFSTQADPFIPAYPRSVLDTMPDAAWTYELFSTGAWADPIHGKRLLARRVLIVRPSIYKLLKPLKVRGVRWSPVRVD